MGQLGLREGYKPLIEEEWSLQELGCVTWPLLQYLMASASDFGGGTARFASHSLRLSSSTLQTLLTPPQNTNVSLYVFCFQSEHLNFFEYPAQVSLFED